MKYDIEEIFQQFQKSRSDIELPIEDIKSKLEPFVSKIVLYGAGSAGIAFLYYLRDIGVFPKFFVDGDICKHGTFVEGLEVISIDSIKLRLAEDALVIVTINTDGKRYCKSFDEELRTGGHIGVHKTLADAGYPNVIDYTWFRRCHRLFTRDKYNLPSCSDVELMLENKERITEVFHHLADEKSKETFYKIVKFRMLDDTIEVPTLRQDNQYFEYDIYNKIDDEVFVDCGAFNGITLNTFLKNNESKFDSYYAIEPDVANYNKLLRYTDTLDAKTVKKIIICNKSVYDDKTLSINLYELNGPGTFASEIGKHISKTICIDALLEGKRATMIKMNIEGCELKALEGAKNTITKYNPALAVAGYHKTWDLWEIPELILKYNPKYKMILRSYMNHISFVYYAIPKDRMYVSVNSKKTKGELLL
nr:FkbM family methyltransferase [uncultured Aminipila sp.]